MKKRLTALLLTLVMLMSMVVVPASAENEENGLSFSVISFTKNGTGIIEENELTSIEKGQEFALKILLKNTTSEPYVIGAYQLLVQYNNKAIEAYTFKSGRETVGPAVKGDLGAPQGNDNGNGVFKITAADGNGTEIEAKGGEYDYATVAYIMFKAKEDVEKCDLIFSLADGDNKITVTKENDPSKDFAMPGVNFTEVTTTVGVNGNPPTLAHVTVTDGQDKVVLDSNDATKTLTVFLDGATSYKYHAHAYSLMGTDITEQVKWTIGDNQTEYGGTSIADTGTIIVSAKAAGIETSIKAALNGSTVSAGGFTVQRTAESENTVTELKISPDNAVVYVPADQPNTLDFSAQALNVYGDAVTGTNITWTVLDSEDKEVPSGWGIRFEESSQGKLTVNRNAMAHPGSYKVCAAAGNVVAMVALTIKLENSVPSGYTLDEGAVTPFAVPTADADGNERKQSYDFPTVTVKDQYGKEMPDATVTWGNPSDELPNGVSVKDGQLYVSSRAAANSFTDGKLEFKVSLRFGSHSTRETFTLTRKASQAAGVTVSGGPTETLLVPGTGEADVTGTQFTAVVKDQYGQTIEDAAISWSVELKNSTLGSVSGVSIDGGSVTVSNAAAETVTDTDAVTFTAAAACGSASGSKEFAVARAASVAKSITVARNGSEDTLLIPGLDSTEKTRQAEFVATVTDQYGAEIQNPSINWSISCGDYKMPDGVTIDPDTGVVSVTIDAAKTIDLGMEHYIFTVTAAVNGTELKDSTQTFKVKREDTRIVGFHLYDHTGIASNDEHGRLLDTGSSVIISNGKNVLFDILPHTQYGDDMTWSTIWQVEIFAPDGSQAIPTDSDKATTESEDSVGYRTELPITSAVKDGMYCIVITETNSETGATPIKSEYSINLMRKADAGLTISGGDDAASKTVTYGETFTLTATAANHGTTGSKWGLSGIDSTILDTVNHNGNQVTLKARKAGTTTFTMTYEDDTYYGSVTYTVTVGKRTISVAPGTLRFSKVYDGTANMGTQTGDPVISNILPQDSGSVGVSMSGGDWSMVNAGKYSVTLNVSLPSAAAVNYQLEKDTIVIPYEITYAVLEVASATAVNRPYEAGKTDVSISSVTFNNVSGTTVTPSDGYTVSGTVTNADAGEKNVTVTVELTGQTAKNYKLKKNTCQTTATIEKINWTGAERGSMSAKYGNAATLDLATIGLPAGWKFGVISVTDGNGILDGTPVLTGSALSAKLKSDGSLIGKTAEISIPVTESTNYNPYAITVTVEVLDKTAQSIEADDITMVYGDGAKAAVKNAVYGDVTYAVASPDQGVISVDPATGAITAHKSGTATVEIRAAGNSDYAAAVKSITVTVTRRTLTVTANDKSAYVGDQVPALDYRVDGLVSGDTLGELALAVSAAEPTKAAGQYDIVFTNADTVSYDRDKYELKTVNGTLTVTVRPVIDDQPRGSDIIVSPMPDGKLTVSTPKAVNGATVTITVTPDENKELKSLEVIDENGNRLPVTELGNGRFSFVMPAGKVTVNAVCGDANEFVNPYTDVKESDWYFDAVRYVTENGLMTGTGAGRFDPNLATSRAMIWTILARMSGVNTSGGSIWHGGSQQWSVTAGVSDGTDPNGTITREQLAAMLYRYAVSKGLVSAPASADLSAFSDAASVSPYAVEAMQWAVSVGLINGMDGKLNPQGSATRAQVATMLMRFAELTK